MGIPKDTTIGPIASKFGLPGRSSGPLGRCRAVVLDPEALELLTGMPIFEFERYDTTIRLISVGRSEVADLPDLLIALAAKAQGSETTLTFEKRLAKTDFFERL